MNNYGQKSVSELLEFSKKGPKIKKILDDLFGVYENDETALSRMQGKDPVNAQDFVTKTFLETFIDTNTQSKISYASATNTDLTTNLNDTTTNFVDNVPLFGNTIVDTSGDYTFLNDEEVRVNFTGIVLVLVNVHINSSRQRTSVNIRLKVNGTPTNGVGATGYVRATNNHEESSLHISGALSVTNNQVISVGRRREANSGTVFMSDIGTSNIVLLRLR
jgi:hypothetical protein